MTPYRHIVPDVPEPPGGVSIYVHIPFCASKCDYCDFGSVAVDPSARGVQGLFGEYCDAVLREAHRWEQRGLLSEIPTIYIGGGTPTVLGDRLPELVRGLRSFRGVNEETGLNVEANPDSLDERVVEGLVEAGATRVSLGVQSLDDEVLAWLGRRHSSAQALHAASLLRSSGLRFSMDLMCGIPVQSRGSWEWTLDDAINTGAGHVSVYPLTVEEDTPLFARVDRGEADEPDADEAAEQMIHAAKTLRAAGYEHYEIASYAKPDQECQHNMRYWTGASYLGIGPGAAGMLRAEQAPAEWGVEPAPGRVRFTSGPDTRAFISGDVTPVEIEVLTPEEAIREDAMLGLRLRRGILEALAEAAGATHGLQVLARQGLVKLGDGYWSTTERGWLLGNEVFTRVWAGE